MRREDEIAIASCAYGSRGSSIDFTAGVKWADANPKSPWISIKDDLPCNHKELIDIAIRTCKKTIFVIVKGETFVDVDYMKLSEDNWHWVRWCSITHWFPIPKLPKE